MFVYTFSAEADFLQYTDGNNENGEAPTLSQFARAGKSFEKRIESLSSHPHTHYQPFKTTGCTN